MQASRDHAAGVVVGPLGADGEPYISAYQTLGAPPPAVVSVSLSRADILAEWYTQLRTALVALGALTMTLSAIVLVLFRQMAARAQAENELRRLQDDEATRLRGANEQLEAALEREQRARRDAESASRLKDEFLMTLSHELRTPLTAIFGWVRMLATKPLSEEERTRALGAVERNARAQTRLIDDLLDVSRAISGKLRLEPRPVQVPDAVRAAIDTVAPAIEAKDIRLDLQIEPGLGPILADPDRVQQIVWNLLSNAIKFTPAEGTIGVSVAQAGDGVEIVVSDSGIGIHPRVRALRLRAIPPGRRRHPAAVRRPRPRPRHRPASRRAARRQRACRKRRGGPGSDVPRHPAGTRGAAGLAGRPAGGGARSCGARAGRGSTASACWSWTTNPMRETCSGRSCRRQAPP